MLWGYSMENRKEAVKHLSMIFTEYQIYPLSCYKENSPVRVFQKLYPDNYYAGDIEDFLSLHDYKRIRRGADLPWWGEKYFENDKKNRVMIISQDSLAKDAGSIVFWANLFGIIRSRYDYDRFTERLEDPKMFEYDKWERAYSQIMKWKIDLEHCYITDASKVYWSDLQNRKGFNKEASKRLLEREIDFCKPDLIILLGGESLKLLFGLEYKDVVEKGEYIFIKGIPCVVSPFITGQGHTQKNYHKRLEIASKLIIEKVTN